MPGAETRVGARTRVETVTRSARTYVLSGDVGLDHAPLRALLAGAGFVEVPVTVDRATFVWAELVGDFNFDKRVYGVRCVLKNVLDDGKLLVTDKGRLHAAMAARFPATARAHMAATVRLRDLATTRDAATGACRPFIVRPVGRHACAGRGIVRVASDAALARAKAAILRRGACPDAIASAYVTNPVLWEGRKTHLRMYWLVCAPAPGDPRRPFRQVLWRTGKIMTAARPYVVGAWDDAGVHDTHVHSTPRNLFFPDDLAAVAPADRDVLYDRMAAVLRDVGELLRPVCRPYPESTLAYEVFGCDFLVTTDLNVVLLEINQRIGFYCIPNDPDPARYQAFTRNYYSFVFHNAIMPLLLPELPPLDSPPPPPPPPPQIA